MLTNDVIDIVNRVEEINMEMSRLDRERNDSIYVIKQLLGDYQDIEITGVAIVETPYGVKDENGRYVNEHCDDSLFCPDSGYGEEYIPIENGDYLKVDYIY